MGTAEAKQGWRDTLTHLPAGRAPRDSPAGAVWAGHCLAGGPHTHHCLLTPALPPCLPITGCWPRDPPAGAVWAGHRPAGGPLPRPPLPAAAPPALGPRAALLSQPGPAGPPAASAARRGARWVAAAQGRRMGWRGVAASLCAGEVGGTAQHSAMQEPAAWHSVLLLVLDLPAATPALPSQSHILGPKPRLASWPCPALASCSWGRGGGGRRRRWRSAAGAVAAAR